MQHHLEAQNRFIRETYPGTEPLERILTLDLETRSTADLKKTGAWVYAADASTEVMCASFAIDDGPIRRWLETDPLSLPEAIPALLDPRTLCCFHNAEFEAAILLHVYGIEIPTPRILDSAAVARHAGLPGALDPLGQFFGVEKDMEGNRTMLKLSKPRRPSKSNPDLFWRPDTKPEDFEKTYAYCDRDVEVAQTALSRMPPLSVFECQVYAATFEMNRRGAPIDRPSAEIMKDTADREKTRLSREIEREFGFTLGQVSEIAGFLGLDSVAKAPLRDLLKDDALHPDHRRVAEARQTFAKTSLNKLPAFIGRSEHDSRAHDNLMYGGAERTLRWSGSGIQLQNLTRGIGKLQEIAYEALHAGLFEFLYEGEIIDILSGMLRGLIRDEAGLLIGDYSQIEARMLAWLVGDTDLLDQFRRGEDPYRIMASKIYHKAVVDVTGDERFMGKQTILGCLETSCKVLTDKRGWVPIHKVKRSDMLWDGVEWVSHQGVLFSGMKPTIRQHGIGMTSDHLLFQLQSDGSLRTRAWSSVLESPHGFQSVLNAANLPSSVTRSSSQKESTGVGTLYASVRAAMSRFSLPARYPADLFQRVTAAAGSLMPRQRPSVTPSMPTCFRIPDTEPACSTGYRTSSLGATIRASKTTSIMAGGESDGGSKIAESFWRTSSRLRGGISLIWSLIASTTTGTTNPEISALSLGQKIWLIGDQLRSSKSRSPSCAPVYDIALAGPRNRFTIMTDQGPILVHNCGYGLGHRGFMSMLDTTYDVQIPVSEAQTIVQAYRRNAPKEVSFWKKVERAMLLAKSKVGKIVKINEKVGITFPKNDEMHIILPSGRRLRYYQVKLERIDDGFAKWSCFGRLKTGAGYGRVSIYGGALTGHITQSSARDVVAHALVEMWRRGYPLILTVHDELVSLKHGTLETFEEIMSTPPAWLSDFPLAVDTFETVRYRK